MNDNHTEFGFLIEFSRESRIPMGQICLICANSFRSSWCCASKKADKDSNTKAFDLSTL